jgi:hypothetical protein
VLDVDGVLNPYAWQGDADGAFSDFACHVARGFPLLLSRAMGQCLLTLGAELCWATTWSESIDEDVAPYAGLPRGLRVAARPPELPTEALTNWKLVQVRALIESEPRPFVWIDDDALDWPGPDGLTAREWAAGLEIPHLLLSPRPEIGLSLGELAEIHRFLSGLARPPG